jgi:hypothetical protein
MHEEDGGRQHEHDDDVEDELAVASQHGRDSRGQDVEGAEANDGVDLGSRSWDSHDGLVWYLNVAGTRSRCRLWRMVGRGRQRKAGLAIGMHWRYVINR